MKIIFWCLIAYLVVISFFTEYTAWLEMIVYPYLLNNGSSLYKDLTVPYTPLFIWFLQVIEGLFGFNVQVTHLITIILAAVNVTLIYFFTNKIWKTKLSGILACLFYCLWFFYFEGNALWFELFQTPFILAGLFFFYRYFFQKEKDRNLLLGSGFLAISFFIKQSTIWIIIFISLWIIFYFRNDLKRIVRNLIFFSIPFVALFSLTSLVSYLGGYLSEYWYWAYKYTFFQLPFNPDYHNSPTLNQLLKLSLVLLLAVLFLFQNKKDILKSIFLLGFLSSTLIVVFPKWEWFHLQPFLAVLSIVTVPSIERFLIGKDNTKRILILILILVWVIVTTKQMMRFTNKPIRFFEPEKYKVAQTIKDRNYLDFYTHNSSDQIYVLTGTVPKIKPYTQYFSSFMEVDGVQDRIIESMEKEKLKYVIYTPFSGRRGMLPGDYRPKLVSDYIDANYHFKEKITEEFWVLERN